MRIEIRHQCPKSKSYRAARVRSLFNAEDGHQFSLDADLPIEGGDWKIGVVVGPSGSGKSSIGRRIWGEPAFHRGFEWPEQSPIIEAIAPKAPFDTVPAALSAVGLGSVPAWLRPFQVLSTGEKFRAELARIVCEAPARIVIDEFSSVVDRRIAQIGSLAFQKAWRRAGGQAVLLSCHYDILDWLEPDWVYDTACGSFSGRGLWRRPRIEVEVRKAGPDWWPYFEPHHYLKLPRMIAADYFIAVSEGEPVAHVASAPHFHMGGYRACRLVAMPEWQGAGVGVRFLNSVCRANLEGRTRWGRALPTYFHTSHPGLAAALRRSPEWRQCSAVLHGENKERCYQSLQKSGVQTGSGFGGHFRAVQGFKFTGGDK